MIDPERAVIDVFVERLFDPPLRAHEIEAVLQPRRSRLTARGIEWREGFLDRSGRRMLCRFNALDEAAVRHALRLVHVEVSALWAGRAYTPGLLPVPDSTAVSSSLVLAQHQIEHPVTLADLRTVESLCEWCFETHRIRLIRILVSMDFRRIVYLYCAPDAESVRLAHRQAGLGLDHVWPYREVTSCMPPGRDAA
jgi:hypothetical protein